MSEQAKRRTGEYIVCQIKDEWHVLFAPDDLPHHYLSIGRFQDAERAEFYASFEQDFSEEPEPMHAALDTDRLHKIERKGVKIRQITARPSAKPEAKQPLSKLETSIMADLSKLMEQYPFGISIKEACEFYGEPDHRIRYALDSLSERQLIRFEKWEDDKAQRAMPLGYARPPMRFTDMQQAVMDAMRRLRNADGFTIASFRMLCRESGHPQGSIVNTLYALEKKGAIEIVKQGDNIEANTYRVLDPEHIQVALQVAQPVPMPITNQAPKPKESQRIVALPPVFSEEDTLRLEARVAEQLFDLYKTYPHGVAYRDLRDRFGITIELARYVAKSGAGKGLWLIESQIGTSATIIRPQASRPPLPILSDKQRKILTVLQNNAVDGTVTCGDSAIGKALPGLYLSPSTLLPIINSLEKKGLVERVRTEIGAQLSIYRLIPESTEPQEQAA